MRRLLTCLALAALLPACGGGDSKDGADPATTKAPPTSAATPEVPGASPLTGLSIAGSPNERRPALAVKIDNAPKARPQVGINLADLVVEEKVEDGVTRFFAVFHSQDAPSVGPVRSLRTTDIFIGSALNKPLFAYSGGAPLFRKKLHASPLVDVGFDNFSGEYRREKGRPAPFNLFTTTPNLYRHAPAGAGPPPRQFTFRPEGSAAAGSPAGKLRLVFTGRFVTTTVDWQWDAAAKAYKRTQDATPHVDGAGEQISARNVIVQIVDYKDTGERDKSNSVVPEAQLVGKGEAWVLSGGVITRGTWAKASAEAVTTFADAKGATMTLTPGRTWIELAPPGSATTP